MNPIETLAAAALAYGWQAVGAALVILLAVAAARRAGLVATGNQARAANLIVSALLFGLSADPAADRALAAAIASLLSALLYEGLRRLPDVLVADYNGDAPL